MTGPEAAYPSGTASLARAATGRYTESALFALTGARPAPTGLPSSHRPTTSLNATCVEGVEGGSLRGSAALVNAEELAILRHVAEGLPIDSVAHRVGMSPRTVRRRMRNLCDRIGVTCAMQAVVWAAHRGLV
jgi:DNA-binding NarL/FixJ family response regulator